MTQPPTSARPAVSVYGTLSMLAAIMFFGFMTIGMPLPVLPVYVHETLGYGAFVVGVTIGIQSVVTLLLRSYAGRTVDTRGPRRAVLTGLCGCGVAGVLYLAASMVPHPALALGILIAGRVVLGFGESLILTGGMSWGIGLLGAAHASKAISWQGVSMYTAIAIGAPFGAYLLQSAGFTAVSLVNIALPAIAFAIALRLPAAAPIGGNRLPFFRVVGLVWRPGLAMTLGSIGYAVIAAFITLYYASHGWSGAAFALTLYSACFIGIRIVLAHAVDRFGGRRVAMASLVFSAIGQFLLWGAVNPDMALVGAGLTGVGFSLVFPALGVEALRQVPPQNRGAALAAYSAFFDLALGLIGPMAGLVANYFGYASIFLCGALGGIVAILMIARLPHAGPVATPADSSAGSGH
ncbi:arabinose transporter [Pandoraea sp. NE5]|uniref:MFS transporter n=1 Tax=unclassified Pandoraea TaxID=2624094 RepID=UPI00095F0EB9|nr:MULTISPECIES: MFS transporter [unclassified Pandoraea]OJY18760.1 MAG: MFS transporter [Pandoraea sp. 64-18]BDD92978.1 arabinose transporter [Pandoraea sp. NE5]